MHFAFPVKVSSGSTCLRYIARFPFVDWAVLISTSIFSKKV